MRDQHGAYHCLLKELRLGDKPSYKNFFGMDEPAFEELLHKVGPLITEQDTHLRDSIPAAEKLLNFTQQPFLAGGCHFVYIT